MIRRLTALLIFAIAAASPALGCAPAPHSGEQIDIVEESAIIEWDPLTKTENFTRRATFKGTAKDFGFLVPTPATPTLTEVSDSVFDTLEEKTARKTVHKTTKAIDWTPLALMLLGNRYRSEDARATAGRPPVEVLATQKLAGYEAVVLDATDAKALNDWLAQHGYATTPDLTEWLDAYVKQGWKITAFKIDKEQSKVARSSAVKMTFTTERPFFPYREPASQRANARYDSVRSLVIFFIGPERVAGTIGTSTFWPGVVTWSDTHLTKFVDTSYVRPGTDDLFFSRAAEQKPYIPPPWIDETIERTHVPIDAVVLGLIVIVFGVRRLRR